MKLTGWSISIALFLLIGAQPALPQASMVSASPPVNGTVSAPREISITFSEPIIASHDSIMVRDAKGARVNRSDIWLDGNGRIVNTSLRPLEAGTYRVDWHVQSRDPHVKGSFHDVRGSFTFRLQ